MFVECINMALCQAPRGPNLRCEFQLLRLWVFKDPGSAWIVFDNTDKCRVFRMLALAHRFLQRFFDQENLNESLCVRQSLSLWIGIGMSSFSRSPDFSPLLLKSPWDWWHGVMESVFRIKIHSRASLSSYVTDAEMYAKSLLIGHPVHYTLHTTLLYLALFFFHLSFLPPSLSLSFSF